ncbi:MAG: crossover junction endodeoxyribonuclease RuvC [Candidatus Caenarcaniphilales bacterium]|nr:crossover junction endodeoxyribonuclease RuvC [Candidatus Caenarcaniphilales bacterium]
MRILGIDPGIALVGYSIIDLDGREVNLIQCGVITTDSNLRPWERLKIIRKDLNEILQVFQPDASAVELLYFTKNIKTGISVAQGRGVILECLAANRIEKIVEFTPTHLKQVLFGNGKASKREIQIMVSKALNLPGLIKPDDAADATALALAFIRGGFASNLCLA